MHILIYHEVSQEDPVDILAVRRDSFCEQMDAENGRYQKKLAKTHPNKTVCQFLDIPRR
jgi:hypothetical protein